MASHINPINNKEEDIRNYMKKYDIYKHLCDIDPGEVK